LLRIVKTLIWRKKSWSCHSVEISWFFYHSDFPWNQFFSIHSVEKSSKTRSQFLRKNCHFFRQINVFTIEFPKEMISLKFLSVIAFYSTFPHCGIASLVKGWFDGKIRDRVFTQCGKTRNFLSQKNISSNQQFSNYFNKSITLTVFLTKGEREFLEFPYCGFFKSSFP